MYGSWLIDSTIEFCGSGNCPQAAEHAQDPHNALSEMHTRVAAHIRIRTIENRAPVASSATSRSDGDREGTKLWWNSSKNAIVMLISNEKPSSWFWGGH